LAARTLGDERRDDGLLAPGDGAGQGTLILISGGTRTGKTTLLSALCNFLPEAWRIVKIEDPEEIWVDRPTVQTVEARP
jgi:pilus assembly protein CpaF